MAPDSKPADTAAADKEAAEARTKAAEKQEAAAAKVASKVPYQQAAHVRQALAERANAEALGLTDRVAAADKILDQAGVPAHQRGSFTSVAPPQERHAEERETTEAAPTKRGPGRPRKTEG